VLGQVSVGVDEEDHMLIRCRGRGSAALTGGYGVGHAFDCVGYSHTIRDAWSATREVRCGTDVVAHWNAVMQEPTEAFGAG
jgi:threonine dehydrogenase-like Zn-dependent dehydrogenase